MNYRKLHFLKFWNTTVIAWMKEYSNYGILIMVLFGVAVDTLWFSSPLFLLYKASEVCPCHMTKLLNEAFKWDDLLNPRKWKNLWQHSEDKSLKQSCMNTAELLQLKQHSQGNWQKATESSHRTSPFRQEDGNSLPLKMGLSSYGLQEFHKGRAAYT